ncbi:DIE2/ALG10 family-domain-containing protein [Haematococcus lacustris]
MERLDFSGIHIAAAAYALLSSIAAALVNRHVPLPYMDEPFHVPQTQQYCRGVWDAWDPKITTLPGLYLLGAAQARVLGAVQRMAQQSGWLTQQWPWLAGVQEDLGCSTMSLRGLNLMLGVACVYVLYWVLEDSRLPAALPPSPAAAAATTQPEACSPTPIRQSWSWAPASSTLWAVTLASLPLHWSYTYLYYTDVGATLFLLCCYWQAHRGRPIIAGLAAALAVMFRQTNAVWVAFVAGTVALKVVGANHATGSPSRRAEPDVRGPLNRDPARHTSPYPARPMLSHAMREVGNFSAALWRCRMALLRQLWPLVLIVLVFAAFLVVNGGVALGDKAAHQPVRHPAQLAYFCLFAASILGPAVLPVVGSAAGAGTDYPMRAVLFSAAALWLSRWCLTHGPGPHPYLLADNRHFTFYIWRKLLAKQSGVWSLLVGPGAGLSGLVLVHGLLQRQSGLWVAGWAVCTAVVLVPAWLLEFRYFTAPFLMLALHLPRPPRLHVWTTLAMYVTLNSCTLYLFLCKPFAWADGSQGRFMW